MYTKYVELRNKEGLTDYAVSKRSGVSRTVLSDWGTGKHIPSTPNVKKLASFFKVPLSYFYDDESEKSNISKFVSADDKELEAYISMLKELPLERRKSIYEQIEFQNTKEVNSNS